MNAPFRPTPDSTSAPFGTTPETLSLIEACVLGNVPSLRTLLQQGADPNATTSCGYAPLHFAALSGRTAAAELLLQHGADPLHRGPSAILPGELASLHGHPGTAIVLRQAAQAARRLLERNRVVPACLSRPALPLFPALLAA